MFLQLFLFLLQFFPIHRLGKAKQRAFYAQQAIRTKVAYHVCLDASCGVINLRVAPFLLLGIIFKTGYNHYIVTLNITQGLVRILVIQADIAFFVKPVLNPEYPHCICAVIFLGNPDLAAFALMADFIVSEDSVGKGIEAVLSCGHERRDRKKANKAAKSDMIFFIIKDN